MKKKLSKILGIGLTLALLTSLVLVAAPVSALTQPNVSLADYDIGATTSYTIMFTLGKDLPVTAGTGFPGSIVIEFPDGTTVPAAPAVTMAGTSGIGSLAFTSATTSASGSGQILTISVTATNPVNTKIGVGAMVQVIVPGVKNPTTPADYTLDVSTEDSVGTAIESAVTSGAYEITVPTIGPVPGIVSIYNDGGILMAQTVGSNAIRDAIGLAGEDYVIRIGPGTYYEAGTTYVDEFNTTYNEATAGDHDGIIFESVGAVGDTILEGSWIIDNNEITLDGLTIKGAMTIVGGDDLLITECVFEKLSKTSDEMLITWNAAGGLDEGEIADSIIDTSYETADDDIGVVALQDGLTVSGCTFTVDYDDIAVGVSSDTTVEDSEFTGDSGVGVAVGAGVVTISGNTFDGLDSAVNIHGTATVTIKDNTITNSSGDAYDGKYYIGTYTGGAIHVESATEVIIVNNTISDTDENEYAVHSNAAVDTVFVVFNNITGNAKNVDAANALDATHNWWGDAAGPASGSYTTAADVTPYLGASVTGATADIGATSLDGKTAASVEVSGVDDAVAGDVIAVAKYSANPQEAIADAIAFYDVYVAGSTDDTINLKFYAGDENSKLYAWSADTDSWVIQSPAFSAYGGYVYDTVTHDYLEGSPFVVVAGEAVAAVIDAPVLAAPASGANDVSLTPTFGWGAVADADGYYFEFADNANFVLPLVRLDGDVGRLLVTAYAYVGELPYTTAYYWRVKAVSGTIGADDLVESGWASAVFITKEEPVEPTPPIVIEEAPELPDITIVQPDIIVESPDVIVPLPAETPITPGWIYAIIGVGALLVIALLVLIVRTRRVA